MLAQMRLRYGELGLSSSPLRLRCVLALKFAGVAPLSVWSSLLCQTAEKSLPLSDTGRTAAKLLLIFAKIAVVSATTASPRN